MCDNCKDTAGRVYNTQPHYPAKSGDGHTADFKMPVINGDWESTSRPNTPTENELAKIEKVNAELSAAIAELETRLSFIMREPEPTIPVDCTPPSMAASPLIATLAGFSRAGGESVRRITSILRRLDL